MLAEIISIGDEITNGIILDTNAQWLTREAFEIGISTLYHTTVGDDLDAIIDVLRIASERVDLVIMTGGLGPTADDLTREAIAKMLDVPLEKDEKLLEYIRGIFASRGREMPKTNEVQAFQPKGAIPINNPNGTAPGIDITVKRKTPQTGLLENFRMIALPGVPAEMKEMWDETVEKSLHEMIESLSGEKRVLRVRAINTFGLGESQVEAMLPDLVNRTHYPKVGITASDATISLRIFGEGETEQNCLSMMQPTVDTIYEKLGNIIFSEGDERLQEVVYRLLEKHDKTLAVIEWGTRGLLTAAIAGSKEANERFLGGIVLSSLKSLENSIRYSAELTARDPIPEGFSQQSVETDPELTKELVRAMCTVALKLSTADYVLAVGPYPPKGSRKGTVFVAFGTKEAIELEGYDFNGHPALMDHLFTKRAMNKMRLTLS